MRKKMFLLIIIIGIYGISLVDFDNSKTKVEVVANKGQLTGTEDFPDENFYGCVLKTLNLGDRVVPTDEQLASITELKCNDSSITNTKGLEKLVNLKKLYLYNNKITSIDVSKNIALKYLSVYNNRLTSLDVTKNSDLNYLSVHTNQLKGIDLTNNLALKELYIYENRLTDIDISKNVALTDLHLGGNQLVNIDVSKNTALKYLYLGRNKLQNIDVSKNTILEFLGLSSNYLTDIDVSKNTALNNLQIYENSLSSIDVSKNTALKSLDLDNNQLISIDVSKNTLLESLDLYYNQLTNIDVTKNVNLKELDVSVNYLTNIDVSKNVLLDYFAGAFNALTSLNVSSNVELSELDVASNKISNLDLNSNILLEYLVVDYNNIKNLNFSKFSELNNLVVYYYDDEAIYGDSFSIKDSWKFLPSDVVIDNNLSDLEIYDRNNLEEYSFEDKTQNDVLYGDDGSSYLVFFDIEEVSSAINGYSGDVSYYGLKQVNFITLSSDKYKIDESNNVIDVDIDDDNTIKNNLKTSLRGATLHVKGEKLSIVYNDKVVKTFTLNRVTVNPSTGEFISVIFIILFSSIVGIILTTNKKLKENLN